MYLFNVMVRLLSRLIPFLLFIATCMGPGMEIAHAEPGVSDTNIKIGMSTPMSGINAPYGVEMSSVISAYFNQVNAAGGVNGRSLSLITLDDGYEADRSVKNTTTLLQEDKVFALTSYYGSSPTTASLPIFTAAKTPLVGSLSGADSLRNPFNRYIFNVRASYEEETDALVKQLTSIGLTNIGVLYQNDGFGKSGLDGVTEALKKHHLQPSVIATVERNSTDVDAAIAAFSKVRPQAIIMITLLKPSTAFVRKLKTAELHPYLAALSPVGADLLARELGELGRGIMISQVMPYPWDDTVPLVRDYKKLLQQMNSQHTLSYYGMEAYTNARLLVEALRLSGKNLTRDKLIEILESMHGNTIGGFPMNYSASNHNGSRFVEITVLGANAKILR